MNFASKMLVVVSVFGLSASLADAKTRTPEEVMTHHNAALKAFDQTAFLSDYADDAVAVTARGIFIGKAGVQKMFEGFGAFREAITKMEVSPEYLDAGVVAAHFKINPGAANEINGTDVMIIRNGKIVFQSPQPPPPAPKPAQTK
jgi:hypothetical protein